MRDRSIKGGVILEILLFLIAGVFLFKATTAGFETYTLKHVPDLAVAEGTVKSVTNHGMTLNIDFTIENKTIVSIRQYVFDTNFVQGQKVSVIYNPLKPGQAALNDKWAQWFWTITLGIPGFMILAWALKIFTTRNL